MAFRILNGVMATLFAFAAALQYNDPDPIRWIVFYISACLISLAVAFRGKAPLWAPSVTGVVALLWCFTLIGGSADTYFHMFDSWEMKSAPVEEARESSGLLIVAAWMGLVAAHAWFRARRIREHE